jgi:hypothetical protein
LGVHHISKIHPVGIGSAAKSGYWEGALRVNCELESGWESCRGFMHRERGELLESMLRVRSAGKRDGK